MRFARYWNFIAQGLKEIAEKKREEQQRQKLLRKAQRAEEDELEEFEEGEEEEEEGEEDWQGNTANQVVLIIHAASQIRKRSQEHMWIHCCVHILEEYMKVSYSSCALNNLADQPGGWSL